MSSNEIVILLHGLASPTLLMNPLAKNLTKAAYTVFNLDYPSCQQNLAPLARILSQQIASLNKEQTKIHFVTHSMGSLVLRILLSDYPLKNIGRVVMLAPPNQGSQVADWLKNNWLYQKIFGPAAQELGTDFCQHSPLPIPDVEIGIIAGNKCFLPLFNFLLPKPHDGLVCVKNTQLKNMTDHLVLPVTHISILFNQGVFSQIQHFLKEGRFISKDTSTHS